MSRMHGGEWQMRQALFAAAVAGVALTAVVATPSQSAPIAPLPEALAHDNGDVTQVWWRYHYHWHHWHHWHWRHWRRW